jgi:predicted nucleic acid-binding protein
VGEALILETTFLIDLERELARKTKGPAQEFLEARPGARLHIPYTVAGELAAGTSLSDRARWEDFLSPFHLLEVHAETAWQYGQIYRYLSDHGLLIGTNDLWIAATALAYRISLATRNRKHFGRVPGLMLADYGS